MIIRKYEQISSKHEQISSATEIPETEGVNNMVHTCDLCKDDFIFHIENNKEATVMFLD